MPEARKNALLQFPRIMLDRLEHVAAVIRFDHDGRASAQAFSDQSSDVTKVHHRRDLYAGVRRGEAKVIDGVVRHGERMEIDLADAKVFARIDLDHSIAQGIGATARLSIIRVSPFANISVAR